MVWEPTPRLSVSRGSSLAACVPPLPSLLQLRPHAGQASPPSHVPYPLYWLQGKEVGGGRRKDCFGFALETLG